jgi:peptidoglycan/LPS O-acetylase OafA/YrhL
VNNKIGILDSFRAFAALSVCLFHFVCTTIGLVNTQWVYDTFLIGQYGVHMFFVISGFIIPWAMFHANYKIKDFFKFFFKRLLRLEPPYIFSIILALSFLYLRENVLGKENTHIDISAAQVILHFGYLIPFFPDHQWLNPVYWTLAIEFQYYILIALLFIPLIRSPWYIRAVIYVLILLLSFFFKSIFIFYWLPIFLLGILMFLYKVKIIQKIEFIVALSLTTACCLYQFPLASAVYYLLPIAGIYFYSDAKVKGLDYLGKMSYSIYLIHPIIGSAFVNYFSHFSTGSVFKIALVCSGILVTLLSAWVMYVLVERPSKRWSSSIKYRSNPSNS